MTTAGERDPEPRSTPVAPLSGITVLGLEQAIAAPLCTRHLADLGARVIKIEQPGSGDATRHYDGVVRGMGAHFVWLNHGKESAALDLTEPPDLDVFTGLLERADVLVSNLAPGALGGLGLAPETLADRYPRLIVVDISGYGRGGPLDHKLPTTCSCRPKPDPVPSPGSRGSRPNPAYRSPTSGLPCKPIPELATGPPLPGGCPHSERTPKPFGPRSVGRAIDQAERGRPVQPRIFPNEAGTPLIRRPSRRSRRGPGRRRCTSSPGHTGPAADPSPAPAWSGCGCRWLRPGGLARSPSRGR